MKAATTYYVLPDVTDCISIHAAREGGDLFNQQRQRRKNISIHAAREGGDAAFPTGMRPRLLFQSTPPVKAATVTAQLPPVKFEDFNPRRP